MTPLLTTKQAAQILRIHPKAIGRLVRAGRLEAIVPGTRKQLFRREAIAAFIESNRLNAADVPVAIGELEDRIGCDVCGRYGGAHTDWCREGEDSHA